MKASGTEARHRAHLAALAGTGGHHRGGDDHPLQAGAT
jgi:hypothetical protein